MSLGSMRESADRITLYCAAYLADQGRYCNTSWAPSWEQMIQYFGLDFEIWKDRARFLAMFECPNCGAPAHSLTLLPPAGTPGMGGPGKAHDHGTPNPVEMARLRAEYEHDSAIYNARREGFEQMHRNAKEAEKAKRKQARDRESGRDPIGPPNPWAHRKKGRWL